MSKSRKRQTPALRVYIPVTVPFTAKQTGETLGIVQWAHPAVRTDRMLVTLLNHKVRGGQWPVMANAFFTERGLISLNTAHVRFIQYLGTY